MSQEKCCVVTGKLTDVLDLAEFLKTLRNSELGKPHHHAKAMEIVHTHDAHHITLYFFDVSVLLLLIKHSFKEGVLRQWGTNFKITDPV